MKAKWALLPLAGIGMLMSHEATYRIAEAEEGHRHGLLEATGHGWLALAGPALLVMAVLSVAAGWSLVTAKTLAPRLWQLIAVQTGIFWSIEILERVVTGHDPIPQASILLIGAIAQAPVSLVVWATFVKVVLPALSALAWARWSKPSFLANGTHSWPSANRLLPRPSLGRIHARAPPSYGM